MLYKSALSDLPVTTLTHGYKLCVVWAHHSWGLHTRTPDPLQEPVQVIQMSDKDAPPPPDPKVDPEYSGGIIFHVLDPDITFIVKCHLSDFLISLLQCAGGVKLK